MPALPANLVELLLHTAAWSALTIAAYWISKRLYRRWPRWWLSPLAVTPILIAAVMLSLHVSYQDYLHSTKWLLALLGPAIVAFAIPIYERRTLICRHWPVLLIGMLAGTATAIGSSWALATLVGFDGAMRLSLLPRSISTPFAVEVSGEIGGVPELTAIFVVITGIVGGLIGDILLSRIPCASALARGSLFGVGAHGAGTARAQQIGDTEGAVAGLVMVLVGLMNVVAAPLIVALLR
ncbi:LrgB family protein [Methyloligella sp. 2.7D]|uniref:LrgB family protein n=1 Tax=unclassified Methyloligella TaxID=2625955 RepID=UPI00157DBDD2|nr:LrgB family protein [Methyloligella sp. GL2]QKP76500.1 LrgB family protein [Methyloligella sp. GL2]